HHRARPSFSLSTVESGAVLTYGSTSALDSNNWSIVTTTLRSASTVGAIAVVGWNIAQRTSVSSTSTASSTFSTASSISSPTSTSATSSALLNSQSTTASSSKDDLPTGTAAGIGVGVAVGAIAEVSPPGYAEHGPQGPVGVFSSEAAKQDQFAQRRSELPGDRETGEMDATMAPLELEGSQGVPRQ
ncbi:LPXTG-domain-containing protein, partial [Teratosphaeria destructans]